MSIKHSCENQLITTVGFLAKALDNNNKLIYILILDFSKAFCHCPTYNASSQTTMETRDDGAFW